jgi:hypothetical protein
MTPKHPQNEKTSAPRRPPKKASGNHLRPKRMKTCQQGKKGCWQKIVLTITEAVGAAKALAGPLQETVEFLRILLPHR